MTESQCPQAAELLRQMHPERRRTPTVHHQRLRDLAGLPHAACSCGWDGPERPDEQWAAADWFGHQVEYETRYLDQAEPEREGGTPFDPMPGHAVMTPLDPDAEPLEFEVVSFAIEPCERPDEAEERVVASSIAPLSFEMSFQVHITDQVLRAFGFEAWEIGLEPRPFHRPGKLCIDGHEYRRRRRARVRRRR